MCDNCKWIIMCEEEEDACENYEPICDTEDSYKELNFDY